MVGACISCKRDKVGLPEDFSLASYHCLSVPGLRVSADSIRRHILAVFPENACIADDSVIADYYSRGGAFLWLSPQGARQADSLLRCLENCDRHGLDPAYFAARELRDDWDHLCRMSLAEGEHLNELLTRLEAGLTKVLMVYATGMQYGFVDAHEVMNYLEEETDLQGRKIPLAEGKRKMLALHNIPLKRADASFAAELLQRLTREGTDFWSALEPSSAYYRSLQQEWAGLNALGDASWEPIPLIGDTLIREGHSHWIVPRIAHRLQITGELDREADAASFVTLTPELLQAVNRFRVKNLLPEDNSVGTFTLRYLNRPLQYYKDRIRINLERARWQYAEEKGSKYVIANVAAFMLQAVNEETDSVLEMRICCGTRCNKTPLLSSRINYVELNPYWNVPQSIIRREMIPAYRQDSAYFRKNRLRIYDSSGTEVDPHQINWSDYRGGVPFTVKQDNREGNSLGRIIFRFPNNFAVYLHDTPSRWAFMNTNRAVSHGCVRLEKPLDFALFLLEEPDEVLEDRIRAAMDLPPVSEKGKELIAKEEYQELKQYNLKEHIPLFLDYHTVYFSAAGELAYADDPYVYDPPLLKALDELNPINTNEALYGPL